MSATTILPDNEAATIAGAVVGAVVTQGDLVGAVVSQGDLPDELGGEEVDGAQITTSDGDEDLQAQPSQIREVIVEAPEVKFSYYQYNVIIRLNLIMQPKIKINLDRNN